MASNSETVANASLTLAQLKSQLVAAYVDQAKTMWSSLTPGDWWNDAVVAAVSGRIALMELAMLNQVRRASISYADTLLKLVGATPAGSLEPFVYPRANTTPWLEAMRPAMLYRHLQAQTDAKPKNWPSKEDDIYEVVQNWISQAYDLLEDQAETDATAASNQASVDRYRSSGVTGYRRIIHPERSKTGTCGLCVAAADRVYATSDLLPLHARCKCTTAPISHGNDPGLNLTQQDLDNLYREARTKIKGKEYSGTNRQALSNIRVKTVTHGELGPILTRNDTKTDGESPQWLPPTGQMTQRQIQRMHDHAVEFANRYRQLLDSDRDWLDFRFDGKSYTFHKSAHTKEAMQWNSGIAKQLSARYMQSLVA